MEEQNTYVTLDVGEASALLCEAYKLLRIEPTKKPRQLAFVFEITDEHGLSKDYFHPAKFIERYRSKDLPVDAYSFFLANKELKSRIHNILDQA